MTTGALQNVFEHFKSWVGKNDADAQDYFDHHEEWCRKFTRRSVPDWMTAPQSRLQDLIFNPNGYISALGNALMQMHRPEAKISYDQRWTNEQGFREVCAAVQAPGLRHYDEVRAIVPQQRRKFFGLVGYNAEVVFNRMLAALRIDLVVPVIDTGRALKLRKWLQQNGFLENHVDVVNLDWLEISYQIREALCQQVPDALSSERSVFAWYLAECLDGVDLPRHDVLRREMRLAGFTDK